MKRIVEERVFIIAAVISMICSLLVSFTAVCFPSMRKRFFMKIILMISIADIFASIGSALGLPPDGSYLCPLQAFLVVVFYKASWCWCSILTYQLYSIIETTKVKLSWPVMHLIGWMIPLFTTLLPLITNKFGRDDIADEEIMGWCYYKGNAEYWDLFTFDLLLFSTLISMAYFTFKIYTKINDFSDTIGGLISALAYYPLSIAIAWAPTLLLAFLINSGMVGINENVKIIYFVCTLLSTQNGTLLAIIFFFKSPEARNKWKELIIKREDNLKTHFLKFGNINDQIDDLDDVDDIDVQVSDSSMGSSVFDDDNVLYRYSYVENLGNFNSMLLPFNSKQYRDNDIEE